MSTIFPSTSPRPTLRKSLAPLAKLRNPLAIVLVSLIPVALTPHASPERHFAWLFSGALIAVLVPLCIYQHLRHHQSGHCPQCDYDLTANTTGICPECGSTTSDPPPDTIASFLEWR